MGGGGGRRGTQAGGPEKLGGGRRRLTLPTFPFPIQREEFEKESLWEWLNHSFIRKPRKHVYKKNQKPRRKKKKWRKVPNSCTLVVLQIKTVQCPVGGGGWLASPHPLCHHFSKLSLLSPKMSSLSPGHASPWPTSL